ncbi:hypothetical protein P9222_04495 [Paenibacillus amylolyticus]|nr:hypothetical protein [Paenibacillus amylolyticus]WFR63583.1 hypothetical protein P9222_04495 [Paenibacillus amylolyticus]
MDRTIRDIELSILETVQSQQAYRLYFNNTTQTSSDTVYAIAQSLRELTNSSSWIQSIYLYDKRNKHVVTVSGSREAESFLDKAWIDKMGTGSIGSGWSWSGNSIRSLFNVLLFAY